MKLTKHNVFALKLKEFYWTVTRTLGMGYLHGRSFSDEVRNAIRWLSRHHQPATARILALAHVRLLDARYCAFDRIGHLAIDFDSYVKDQILSHRKIIPILLRFDLQPANSTLLSHWRRHIHIIGTPQIENFLQPFLSFPKLVDSLSGYCSVLRSASRTYDVQSRWAGRGPLLRLSKAQIARGEAQLRVLGIPDGAWFVCIHSREGGYSPVDEGVHSYRNANIDDYSEAMRAIVARGGWCIRVGDPTMRAIDPMVGVVDYALSASKSDWMDVFLCAHCRFFLGSSSGLFGLTGIFGKPSALANMAPLGCAYSPFPGDISIPKLLTDSHDRVIPLPQAFSSEISELRLATEFMERGLRQIDNTPEEIAELAIEMMDRLDGCVMDERDDADLQAHFHALMRPHHYSWFATSRIGRGFLRRHRALLEMETEVKPEQIERADNARCGSVRT